MGPQQPAKHTVQSDRTKAQLILQALRVGTKHQMCWNVKTKTQIISAHQVSHALRALAILVACNKGLISGAALYRMVLSSGTWFIWEIFTKIVSQQTCFMCETFFVKIFQMNQPVVTFGSREYSSHLTNFRNNNALWFILIKHNLQDILLLLLENHLQMRDWIILRNTTLTTN